jgi:hypothetical protein
MDIRQFRNELAQAFETAGFERRTVPRCRDPNWLLPGSEVERTFSQHAIRRPWGCQLSGTLLIDVPAFRSWLCERFPIEKHGIVSGGLLFRHILNERDMFFAVEDEQPPYQEWVSLIRRRLAVLPDTIGGLLRAVREKAPGLRIVWNDHESPKAWSYFEAWATGNEPNNPPPQRLPTGQIVDIAANDPV